MSARRNGNRPRASGQIVVIVAVLLMVVLLLLALAVDAGRLFITRSRQQRAAQAAADAGISLVAEHMVTLAVPRQTVAAGRPPCVPDAGYGASGASCTATPMPSRAEQWLTDDDRATLVAPAMQTQAAGEARAYAAANRGGPGDPGIVSIDVFYPDGYHPQDAGLRLRVSILARLSILFAQLLGDEELPVNAEAVSEIPQR
ncbi:MAG TPA: pilus assembly protein TadG-related protein [Anaerolineales bacterium]|nr:pilus assembly protein TadG-related protein [Anaerolineales bacterium]